MGAGAAGADKEKMTTKKQIAANRRNALKSTGPKTEAGRRIVSRNAITHGLTGAQALVLPEEEDERTSIFDWARLCSRTGIRSGPRNDCIANEWCKRPGGCDGSSGSKPAC